MRSGQYMVPTSRIAYASQDALIIPGTVRDNITFGLDFHEQRYQDVLAACALIPDLAKMKSGDQTMLGEKGSTLSGGQKQRIVSNRPLCSCNITDTPIRLWLEPYMPMRLGRYWMTL